MPLIQKFQVYDFSKASFINTPNEGQLPNGFSVRLRLSTLPSTNQRTVLYSCRYFTISAVKLNKTTDALLFTELEQTDRTYIYADENGDLCFLEINLSFKSPYLDSAREICLDLPLFSPDVLQKEIYFLYDGLQCAWIVDGEVVNNDMPFGALAEQEEIPYDSQANGLLREIAFASDPNAITKEWKSETTQESIQFYSPRGYNTWIGDVANFYHNGVYHLIYLWDRHHHHSRWKAGAHTTHQLITKDFITWEECEPIVLLDEPWKTLGTGSMFYHDGLYYYAHGWHTARMVPRELTARGFMDAEFKRTKEYSAHTYGELFEKGLHPSGSNYAISKDGVHFESTNIQFHMSENPAIFPNESGGLTMIGGYGGRGVWHAESINGPWRKIAEGVSEESAVAPSSECPCQFEVGDYTYLIMGGTGFWMKKKGDRVLRDLAIEGYDVYDGLVFPMATVTDTGRILLGGWIDGYQWGSLVLQRELFQSENGLLGMKWIGELAPNKHHLTRLPATTDLPLPLDERQSYYFEFDVEPNENEPIGIRFCGETDCMLWLDGKREEIQIGHISKESTVPTRILPMYEAAPTVSDKKEWRKTADIPLRSVDFCLPRASVLKKNYTLKIHLHYERKFDSVLIDCEIGGERTLISNRVLQRFHNVKITSGAENLRRFEAYFFPKKENN